MPTIYLDSAHDDGARRDRLYSGDLFGFSPGPSATKLAELARELSESAFAPHDPQVAQESMPAERYVEILAELKPGFIHHPRAKELIAGLLSEVGCDIDRTYFDVPRLRTMAHGEYLKAGLAYQFHPHRDTWFSAPFQQLNWWLPVYAVESRNCMAFHPQFFDTPVRNSSAGYDYDEWSKTGRQEAAKQVKKETRKQPQAEEPLELEPDVRVVTPPGGTIVFSAAQLHSTVPNTTNRRGSASTSARSTWTTSQTAWRRRTSTLSARARRSATSCARATSSHCPRRSSPRTTRVPGWPRQPGDRLPLRAAATDVGLTACLAQLLAGRAGRRPRTTWMSSRATLGARSLRASDIDDGSGDDRQQYTRLDRDSLIFERLTDEHHGDACRGGSGHDPP